MPLKVSTSMPPNSATTISTEPCGGTNVKSTVCTPKLASTGTTTGDGTSWAWICTWPTVPANEWPVSARLATERWPVGTDVSVNTRPRKRCRGSKSRGGSHHSRLPPGPGA